MKLTQINKDAIIENFKTLNLFNTAIDDASLYLENECKMMMQNIKMYYSNLFVFDIYMVKDVLNLYDTAIFSINKLTLLYNNNPLFIFKFLLERIKLNVLYVDSIRQLA